MGWLLQCQPMYHCAMDSIALDTEDITAYGMKFTVNWCTFWTEGSNDYVYSKQIHKSCKQD